MSATSKVDEKLKIVEGVESVWHYHLSKTGESGKEALCGNKRVMATKIPLSTWNSKPNHIPSYYQKITEEEPTVLFPPLNIMPVKMKPPRIHPPQIVVILNANLNLRRKKFVKNVREEK